MLKPTAIEARDLPDAWFQCVSKILEPDNTETVKVDKGSFEGEYRLQFDFITGVVHFPGARPLIPDIPPHLNIPPPVKDMNYVEHYFTRYMMSDVKEEGEQYTYGERITAAQTAAIAHIDRKHTYFPDGPIPPTINQIDAAIDRYKKFGYNNNQLTIQVGQPADIMLDDPPCLRTIDPKIKDGKLNFIVYFRSWDLWNGFPANLSAIQLMKEYMAENIGVEDGEIIFTSKSLHLYGYVWEIAGKRRGLTEKEMEKLLAFIKQ